MSSEQSSSSRSFSSSNGDENAYLTPRIVLREEKEKDPVQIKIRVKKPKNTRSLERPVCFRVRDGRQVEPLPVCPAPFRLPSKPRQCVPLEPAYDVAPVVYLNPDGSSRKCGPCGPAAETLRDPDCGCPIEGSAVEKTLTKNGSDDEPLVIRIGPTGDFTGNGNDERPVYKINFKNNVMNVTSNIDFMVKKMERTSSTSDRDPDAQKYLIKPILKHIPPVTVTVRPHPIGNQNTATTVSEDRSSTGSRSVPNEYAETSASTQTRTVQQTLPPQTASQYQYTPEQLAAAYAQQQPGAYAQQQPGAYAQQQPGAYSQQPGAAYAQQPVAYTQQQGAYAQQQAPGTYGQPGEPQLVNGQLQITPEHIAAAYKEIQANAPPGQQYEFSPEQLAAAYQQQQSGEPLTVDASQVKISPEQFASAYKEQQQQAKQQEYSFTPEQLANAYRQQQAGQPALPGQLQISPEQLASAYRDQQVAQGRAQTQYAQQGAAPQGYAYTQQQPAPTQYAQPGAQQQAYAYQQAPPAQTQYAQPGAAPQGYAYPQQPGQTQYAQPGAQQQAYAYQQAPPAPTQYAQQGGYPQYQQQQVAA